MYWKGMWTTIRSITKSCRACQVNKKWKLKCGYLPPKTVITTPWRTLCVNLVSPYTLKGKDGSVIEFMALTMIDPAFSWFEIVELPLVRRLKTFSVDGRELLASEEIFNKSSDCIAWLVNKLWLSRYPRCWYLVSLYRWIFDFLKKGPFETDIVALTRFIQQTCLFNMQN